MATVSIVDCDAAQAARSPASASAEDVAFSALSKPENSWSPLVPRLAPLPELDPTVQSPAQGSGLSVYLSPRCCQPLGQVPQQAALGHLRVHLQGSVLTSSMITPTLMLNNQPVKASYGPNDYQLPAGQYHVSAYGQWMRQYGQAALDVAVYPGQTVEVFYAAPLHQFTTGTMGFSKQSRKGLGFFVGLIGAIMVIVVLMLAIGLLAS